MIAKAENKFVRIAPRKVREVINLIRGEDTRKAQALLCNLNRRPVATVQKTLTSAIANAKSKGIEEGQLYISRITADEGPMWKRFRAVSFGRATEIFRRTTHLRIELDLKGK